MQVTIHDALRHMEIRGCEGCRLEKECAEQGMILFPIYDFAHMALEKQIPKKPSRNEFADYLCPSCDDELAYVYYCPNCGQAIDWKDDEQNER